ncbi:DUF6106 family protein [Anaeromicropila herbilytica]|uniref:Uncharacterized protein n=1 Tax=Anaeromicropila herbilytica TaxID=2785025 RepID=A0A7R7ENY7_9FIRM|nr:DUF6106 family protein [Anaeromicropila herbilytica]BCN32334.1 hypothetical protein bsdtb5_36290 [Anaeromicropila herbilytica]
MNELYAEASVKRKETMGSYLARFGLIFIAVASVMLSFVASFLMIFAVAIIAVIIFYFPRLNVEYEYVFCDGQLDFDKIMGNSRRKTKLRIDMEQVTIAAPIGSHELDQYTHIQNIKVRDFSSGDSSVKPYVIMMQVGNQMTKILFEPSEKMIACMKQKAPRKVITY